MRGRSVLVVIAVAAHVMVGVLYFASGLVIPYPWVFGMWVLWLGWAGVLFVTIRSAPAWSPLVPVGALAMWVLIVLIGEWAFGWTA